MTDGLWFANTKVRNCVPTGYYDGDDEAGSDNEQDHIKQEELDGSTPGRGLCPDEMLRIIFFRHGRLLSLGVHC